MNRDGDTGSRGSDNRVKNTPSVFGRINWIFVLMVILCVAVLVMVYYMQSRKTTDDISSLFHDLLMEDPKTTAFTLGWIDLKKAFKNVYPTKQATGNGDTTTTSPNKSEEEPSLTFDIRYESFPVDKFGVPILLDDGHGEVIDKPNGFVIRGVNENALIQCPDEFEGSACTLRPLCGSTDVGHYKRLNFAQFSYLAIQDGGNISTIPAVKAYNEQKKPTHPRLYAYCLNREGDYRLHACAINKLLVDDGVDTSSKPFVCVSYDICSDHLSGMVHNYQINENSPVEPNQYYRCSGGKSELHMCADEAVYSSTLKGCVSDLDCLNAGNKQIPINDEKYIQCANDIGTTVTCDKGVISTEGVLSCFVEPVCEPRELDYSDDYVRFVTGRLRCVPVENDDVAVTKFAGKVKEDIVDCNTTNIERTITTGIENDDFITNSFKYSYWPDSVVDDLTNKCVDVSTMNTPNDPRDDILHHKRVLKDFKLLKAQIDDPITDFDIVKRSYTCDTEKHAGYVDYVRFIIRDSKRENVLIRVPDDSWLDARKVCFSPSDDIKKLKDCIFNICWEHNAKPRYTDSVNNADYNVYVYTTPIKSNEWTEPFESLPYIYRPVLGAIIMVSPIATNFNLDNFKPAVTDDEETTNNARAGKSAWPTLLHPLPKPPTPTAGVADTEEEQKIYCLVHEITRSESTGVVALVSTEYEQLPDYLMVGPDYKTLRFTANPHCTDMIFPETETRLAVPMWLFDRIKTI